MFLGEWVWVGPYIGLGRALIGDLEAASSLAVNVLGLLIAGILALRARLVAERGRTG